MKKSKIELFASLCVILVFLGIIFGLSLLSVYKLHTDYVTYSYYENRNLASFPTVEKKTVLDGSYFTKVEDWCRDHSAKRNGVLAYHTRLNMDILKRPVVNGVVVTDDVLLPYNKPEIVDYDAVEALAETVGENLLSHSKLCESYGGKFYYVAVPCQYVYYEDNYPWYLNSRSEYTEATSKALFSKLDSVGVSYIDMLEDFEQNGHLPEFSSRVDNHYGIFGALETYNALMNKINEDTDFDLQVMTEDDYTVTALPNPYVGSRTRKLLGLRKSDEKMYIITPNENVPFTRWNFGSATPGAPIVYTMPETDTQDVLYTIYMGGDVSITEIVTNRPELPTVLIYGDSFTNAVESLIWYNFDTMYSLDFRHYNKMTLEEFFSEKKPDIVVCIRDYEQLINPTANGQ